MRRNRYREIVRFDGDTLRIEFGMLGGVRRGTLEMPRTLARLVVEPGERRTSRRDVAQLLGPARGDRRCLTEEERARLADASGSC